MFLSCVVLLSLCLTLSFGQWVVTGFTPQLFPTTGGTITVTGSGFSQPMDPYFVTSAGDLIIVAPFISSTSTTIILSVPAGTGTNWGVAVQSMDGNTLFFYETNAFSYQSPTISAVTEPPAAGGTITITGTNLGPSGSSASATFNNGITTYPCTSISTAHTSLTCNLIGFGGGSISVNINGQVSNSHPVIIRDYCSWIIGSNNLITNSEFENGLTGHSTTVTGAGSITTTAYSEALGCGSNSLRMFKTFGGFETVVLAQAYFTGRTGQVYSSVLSKRNASGDPVYSLETQATTLGSTFLSPGDNTWRLTRLVANLGSGAVGVAPTLNVNNYAGFMYNDNLRLCFLGDSGCLYEIISLGVPLHPYSAVSVSPTYIVIFNNKKALAFTESPSSFGFSIAATVGFTVPQNSGTNVLTSLFLTIATSASTTVSVTTDSPGISLGTMSTTTTYNTFTLSLPSSCKLTPVNVRLPQGTGYTVYINAVWAA